MIIATLQFAPQLGNVEANIARADQILSATDNLHNVDLIVCPELALSGYNFNSLESIDPYLEVTGAGISALWAYKLAARLNCLVTIGYPEKTHDYSVVPSKVPHALSTAISSLLPGSKANSPSKIGSNGSTKSFNFNSAITIGADGAIVAHYRKSFLYYTDATWASPSPTGFSTISMPLSRPPAPHLASNGALPMENPERYYGKFRDSQPPSETALTVTFAICMDINPEFFTSPWEKREVATYVAESEAAMLVMSTAWLTRLPCVLDEPASSPVDAQISDRLSADPSLSYPCCSTSTVQAPDWDSFQYWLNRLEPLIKAERNTIVVIANRVGLEPGAVRSCDLELVKPPDSSDLIEFSTVPGDQKMLTREKVEQDHIGSEPTEVFTREVDEGGEHGIVSTMAHYAGSSAVLILGHSKIRKWGLLGRGEEKVLVADLSSKEEATWVIS